MGGTPILKVSVQCQCFIIIIFLLSNFKNKDFLPATELMASLCFALCLIQSLLLFYNLTFFPPLNLEKLIGASLPPQSADLYDWGWSTEWQHQLFQLLSTLQSLGFNRNMLLERKFCFQATCFHGETFYHILLHTVFPSMCKTAWFMVKITLKSQ